ncbi:MAG: twin-arginine translocase subunit TatC [Candidatus Eisenbacteria bacterium]|uniref:Sec-independent protein translocase protein TatC n=1 Tax=Eiseniibacteriota bacterium TaxID=2212470 RepID=A0A956M3Q4_UNCEI|nr:twin-arginine translocase subunit TatC [Candidatus Eisenbacteria bacterium]MCA9751507.1 twin-arginine translocase subunit TatC [Gemmatimonadota bacterium]
MTEERPGGEMTLVEHLEELRTVLLQSLLAASVAAVAAWFLSDRAIDLLVRPAIGPVGDLKFISPTGAFMLRMKTAIGLGLFLAAPFIVWRVWTFVVPGLLKKERKVAVPVVLSSVLLFYAGAAFAYLVILPIALTFLLGFGTQYLQPMITAEHYFDFAVRLTLAFGAVFQFPLVVTLLTWWGILDPDFLKRYWRWGVVLVFVLSAILTPPDVASQLLMAGPVLLLYLISLLIAQGIARSRRKEAGKDVEEPRD